MNMRNVSYMKYLHTINFVSDDPRPALVNAIFQHEKCPAGTTHRFTGVVEDAPEAATHQMLEDLQGDFEDKLGITAAPESSKAPSDGAHQELDPYIAKLGHRENHARASEPQPV